jgi:hypothetical protein
MSSPDNVPDANLYISAGFHLRALLYPGGTECRWIVEQIKRLINHLNSLRFTHPRKQLEELLREMEDLKRTAGEQTKPDAGQSARIHTILKCVDETVRQEALARRLIALQESDVSTKLRDYARRGTLNPTQAYLYNETARCLETGTNRSAIVMAWNLAYDRIRQWVFTDPAKLVAFNKEMAKIQKNGRAVYDPIVQYSDFFDGPNEAKVIDLCCDAQMLKGKEHDDLRSWLRRRNESAHASDKQRTINQANALVDDLIDCLDNLGI